MSVEQTPSGDYRFSGQLSQDQFVSAVVKSLAQIQATMTSLLMVQVEMLSHLTGEDVDTARKVYFQFVEDRIKGEMENLLSQPEQQKQPTEQPETSQG